VTLEVAGALGLVAGDAVVLNNSNKLSLRLVPGEVVARVALAGQENARLEVELAGRLGVAGSPVVTLDPRAPGVYERDGFVVTFWSYHEAVGEVRAAEYAGALRRLHAGMRQLDVPVPHVTDRVAEARRLVAERELTPELPDAERELLGGSLRALRRVICERGAPEQVLHGEPHPGNLLGTAGGPLFIDFETCCRGPVEFDLAHAPEEVADHYPGVDRDLLRECRMLVLAMVTTWRWDRGDQLPGGRELAAEWLAQLRAALDRYPLDVRG
jgi:hypothetical protein